MKYYDSIDMITLWRWRKAMGGELQYCRIDIEVGDDEHDEIAWNKLRDEHIAMFGLSEAYEEILDLQMRIAQMQCDYVISGTTFMLNKINRLKAELKEILERVPEGTIDDCLVILSKWLSFHFDEKERTVKEFRNYLDAYKKECDRLTALTQKDVG